MHIVIINIIAVLFLSASVAIPLAVLGPGMRDYLSAVWPMVVITFLALGGINAYFLMNRRLISLLKKEDWPALTEFLEKKIFTDGKYSLRNTRLLIHSYLLLEDFSGVARLEEKTAAANPALLNELALAFGAARLIGRNPSSVDFFKDRLEKGGGKYSDDNEWLLLFYGFSLFVTALHDRAKTVFAETIVHAKNGIVIGLSAFFLSEAVGKRITLDADCCAIVNGGAEKARNTIKSLEIWRKKAAKIETEIYGTVIRKSISDAGEWLFKGKN